MSVSHVELPVELQRIILENLYGEWCLYAHEPDSSDRFRKIALRPSPFSPVSPLLVNRAWRQYTTDLLSRNFCGVLDMTGTTLRTLRIVDTRLDNTEIGGTRISNTSRPSDLKESTRPYSLTFDFSHLYNRITTLRVDSCSMLVAALSIFQEELTMLENIEVLPTFKFRVYEGQLSYSEMADLPRKDVWGEGWESWFKTWIGFTWSCSQRSLSSSQKHRYNIFYKQTFIFEDFNAEQLLVTFDVTSTPFTIVNKQWL